MGWFYRPKSIKILVLVEKDLAHGERAEEHTISILVRWNHIRKTLIVTFSLVYVPVKNALKTLFTAEKQTISIGP